MRRRVVGGALRRYRENVGYALEDAAHVLECDRSKISRIETGPSGIRPKELRELLTEYGVPPSEQLALVSIASRGGQHSWWHPYADILSDAYLDYVIMEAAASEIMAYEAQLIPDLLQTDDYTRPSPPPSPASRRISSGRTPWRPRRCGREVDAGRQPPARRRDLGEGALHQAVGGGGVLAGQIGHLARLSGEAPSSRSRCCRSRRARTQARAADPWPS